ncbi:hypothetical protein T05_7152 [Trichinella murrelli]|uniref:Uncharacterized protein n=1 Tax=Trichinella murrelli TaxID=144512 RepID=A0A0V0TN28_9BILA|nr:hypothetical protein T05_7152 [Trichinella murrelli]
MGKNCKQLRKTTTDLLHFTLTEKNYSKKEAGVIDRVSNLCSLVVNIVESALERKLMKLCLELKHLA